MATRDAVALLVAEPFGLRRRGVVGTLLRVAATIRYYMDTEFLEDGRTIDLISIGLVQRGGGREYYAVSDEFDVDAVRKHPFLAEHVWPQLPLTRDTVEPDRLELATLDRDDPVVKPRSQIRDEVHAFLIEGPGEPRLAAFYSAYDHVALAQLFGSMVSMPPQLPWWTADLKELHDQLGSPELPEQKVGLHHALHDARHDAVIDAHLMRVAAERLRPRETAPTRPAP